MTVAEYRKHPALNFSLAKHLLTSPAHFKAAKDEEQEETDAMRIGTIAHAMILEGKSFEDMYAIKPKGMTFASAEGKLWKAKQTLPIIKADDANAIPRMAAAVAKNTSSEYLLKTLEHRETPVFATLKGVECKCLLDSHGQEFGQWSIADLKTAVDASPRKFASVVMDRHYDLQMVWYQSILATMMGMETPPLWSWIVVEKKPPFFNIVYTGEDFQESGERKLELVLDRYKECQESGKWPFLLNGVHKLKKPSWA